MSKKRVNKLSEEEIEKLYPNEKYIRDYSAVSPSFLIWLSVALLVLICALQELGVVDRLLVEVKEISSSGRFGGR